MAVKPKCLESDLQQLDTLLSRGIEPNVRDLEQYATPPHIASWMLLSIEKDISGKRVLDLGCGCGVLSIGCALVGAKKVLGIDVDGTSLEILSDNVEEYGLKDVVSFVEADVTNLDVTKFGSFDVVVMNPPFGTKRTTRGIDRVFVETGLQMAPVVYSLHKLSTRDYWMKHSTAAKMNCCVEVEAKVKFNIDRQYKHHVKKSVDIEVGMLKFFRTNK